MRGLQYIYISKMFSMVIFIILVIWWWGDEKPPNPKFYGLCKLIEKWKL